MRNEPSSIISKNSSTSIVTVINEIVSHWDLLYILAWRDIRIRYKQSVIGIAWVLLQPILTMVVFTFVFGHLAKLSSDGLPYAVFSYCGLLPWLLFQRSMAQGSGSLLAFASIMTKVYFPRVIAPLAVIITALFDFIVSFAVLGVLMAIYKVVPGWQVVFLPLFLMLVLISALGTALWLSAINIEFRDVQHVLPFLAQLWMYLTPVVYPLSSVPEHLQIVYALNPVSVAVEGFRWALLNGPMPGIGWMLLSAGVNLLLLFTGLRYFMRTTPTLADRI